MNKMKMKKDVKVTLYLTCKKRPFIITLDDEGQALKLKLSIQNDEIVSFGPLTFRASDFKYMIVE